MVNKPNTDSNQKTVGWNNIDWRKVEKYTFKLQTRIFTASKNGQIKIVRKLQKTLINSWSGKALAVRRVTQDNRGRKTAGVDGIKVLSPEARLELIGRVKITGKGMPTRRIWIPKPGKSEKRPLGIPTINDRVLQALIKLAIEPEWEAKFESNSYGFRPGRSCHDAIKHIKQAINAQSKYVLDADIAQCFDRINHEVLLNKLNYRGKLRKQIKSWLKSGVIDNGTFNDTKEGTPQGGVLSPLLANIALDGIQKMLVEYAENDLVMKEVRKDRRNPTQSSKTRRIKSLTYIRYADDFVVLHKYKKVVLKCKELISKWLNNVGLELKSSKTRITHTLNSEESEDGKAGFDFLGHHIQQYPSGKHCSPKSTNGSVLGFKTLITPSKSSCKEHQRKIRAIVKKHKYSSQEKLINELNPVIRGWCNYYKYTDAQGVKEYSRQDFLVWQKLRAWGKHRCNGDLDAACDKYFTRIGKRSWIFAVIRDIKNPLQLILHTSFGSSSTEYVKVKGNYSPYDGKLIYWSKRMGQHPYMPTSKAILLRNQKGKCRWCGLTFREGDTIEKDHILATALGGSMKKGNYQLLHGHCHDRKTAIDLSLIRDKVIKESFHKLTIEWSKVDFYWKEDIPVILNG